LSGALTVQKDAAVSKCLAGRIHSKQESITNFMAVTKKLNLIGPTIREMRIKRKWTQKYLAEKVRSLGWNISRTSLAQMEATHKRITDCDLLFLANALEANIADCFPIDATAEMLRDKIRSRRLMLGRVPAGAPGKIHRNGHCPQPRFLSKVRRSKSWKPRST
jgi:transcriptional regulator with XRE-family HTH domain